MKSLSLYTNKNYYTSLNEIAQTINIELIIIEIYILSFELQFLLDDDKKDSQ